MELQSFGFSRDPFQRSSELDDACLPNTIASLLSELQSGLRSPQGLSVLVAASGSGKSLAAAAFARRLGSVAQVALLSRPSSSVSAIAREALAKLGGKENEQVADDAWAAALRDNAAERRVKGRATVLILDDAERLSPQTLEDLATLFGDEEPNALHIFLFGDSRLLDRMHAGPEKALHAHLLQICRLDPLGVRESVRYLERRFAICGGELGSLFSDEAIDELVQKAAGRLMHLEQLAAEALERAAARKSARVLASDIVAIAERVEAQADRDEKEEEVMAAKNQLRFELPKRAQKVEVEIEEEVEEEEDDWGASAEDESDDWEYEDDEEEEDEEESDDEGEEEETWLADDEEEEEEEDEDEGWETEEPQYAKAVRSREDAVFGPARGAAPAGEMRKRFAGRAVLSLTACLALVWAANNLPGPDSEAPHGRDAQLFPEPLSSKPQDIMRLAQTVEAADADAQVQAWRAQPPKPEPAVLAKAEDAGGQEALDEPQVLVAKPAASSAAAAAGLVGPPAPEAAADAVAKAAPAAEAEVASAKKPVIMEKPGRPATVAAPARVAAKADKPATVAKASTAKASSKKGPVYTVQLGAFKTRRNAEDLATKLKGKPTKILQEGGLYRVFSGSFASKRDAVTHEATLRRAGHKTFVRTAVF